MKKLLMGLLAAATLAAIPLDVAMAAKKKNGTTAEQRHKLTLLAIQACRKKFGSGATLHDIEFYNGKIKRVWCY